MHPIFARGNVRTGELLHQWQRQAQTDKAPRVVLRLQAVRLSLEGRTTPDIARLLGVDRTAVYDWICLWNEHRLAGLKEGHRSGRPSELSAAQKEQLVDIVESGPIAYGLNTGVWTSPLLGHVVAEEFGVCYHAGHVRKLLKALGCSVQRPTTRLVQADPRKQNAWVRYTYPNLKKSPSRRRANRLRGRSLLPAKSHAASDVGASAWPTPYPDPRRTQHPEDPWRCGAARR